MQQNPWDLPPPPGVEPVVGPKFWRWLVGLAVAAVLALVAIYVPVPALYAFVPGPVEDVEQLIKVKGASTYSSEGNLFLTTVRVDESVTLLEWIEAGFDADKSIISEEDFTGGLSREELTRQTRRQMKQSKENARLVALTALGFGPEGDGARVTETIEGLPARDVLEAGDVITKVDGRPITTTCDLTGTLRDIGVGQDVDVTIVRDKKPQAVTITTAEHPEDPGSAVLGVVVENVNFRFDSDIEVTIETGEIGGPSAGLMFALALYDRLTPTDLTEGRAIAGTGTIACDGGVGTISGIEQKVAGAEAEGAEVFLVPLANEADALQAADDIEIVPVDTFEEAVSYLEDL